MPADIVKLIILGNNPRMLVYHALSAHIGYRFLGRLSNKFDGMVTIP